MRSGIFGIILTVILDFNEISDLSNQNFSNSVLFTKVNAKTCKKGLTTPEAVFEVPCTAILTSVKRTEQRQNDLKR